MILGGFRPRELWLLVLFFSGLNFVVDGSGHWAGDLLIPYGIAPGAAQLTATCFDASHASQVQLDYQAVPFTVTVPTFTATPGSNAVGSQAGPFGDYLVWG